MAGDPTGAPRGSRGDSPYEYRRLAEILKRCVAEPGPAVELALKGLAVIPYRDEGGEEPKPVPDIGRYADLLRMEPGEELEERLVEAWERRCGDGRRKWWGILLGPPSGHAVMLDLDSDEVGELWARDRRRWVEETARLIEELRGLLGGQACLVRSRRGGHAIFRVAPETWPELNKRYKANSELGVARIAGREYKVEFRTLGATPIVSRKHAPVEPCSPGLLGPGVLERLPIEARAEPAGARAEASLEPDREIPASTLNELASLLSRYWVEGHRHRLALGLAGLLAKAGYSRASARRLVERIAEAAGDEELGDRLRAVDDTYDKVAEGLGDEVAGKTLLVDELEAVLRETGAPGDPRTLAYRLVERIEELLGRRSSDILVGVVVRENKTSIVRIVNDPRRGLVRVTEPRDPGEPPTAQVISAWYIGEAELYATPSGEHWRVRLVRAPTGEDRVAAGDPEEIARYLRRLSGVTMRSQLEDAVSGVLQALLVSGRARRYEVEEAPGLYPGGRLVWGGAYARLLNPPSPDPGEARRALRLLAGLRSHYRDPAKFDTALLWAGYAVASYSFKEAYQVKQVYLLLHGERQTGKTTLARIIAAMWPVVTNEEEPVPEEGQSEYRLAWKLSITTTPVIEDEVQGISTKKTLVGLLKRAATGIVVRWRGDTGARYKARAALVMTSNYREVLEDDALRERVLAIEFTMADRPRAGPDGYRAFRRLLAEYRRSAPHLGSLLLRVAAENWDRLRDAYTGIYDPVDALEAGRLAWRLVAEALGEEPPWLSSADPPGLDSDHGSEEHELQAVLDIVKREIVNAARAYGVDKLDPTAPREMVSALAAKGLLPAWMAPTREGLAVTRRLIDYLRRDGVEPIGGLKGLAERLGFPYKVAKKLRARAMIIPWGLLEDVLVPAPEGADASSDTIILHDK